MKKPLWAELVSLTALIMLFIGGCAKPEPEPPPPEPKITVTVEETNKESSIEIYYAHHDNNHAARVSLSSADEVKAYRTQLEFVVVKLKEAEEKMHARNIGGTADERSKPVSE